MEKQFNAGLAYSDFKQRQFFYILAAFVAFTMSSYFVVGYLAGSLKPWEWDAGQWMNAFVGIGITAVMTGYQFVLYSAGNVEGGKKATVVAVCVAVGFSLLSEVGQGMERDNIRMETKSQESPTYKAIVGALAGSTGAAYNPYSADLQSAEMKLARCQERMAKGKERDCVQSQARVDAVNKMIANADQQSQSKALALAESAKTMERDEKNYHPLVNLIREAFFVSGTVGSFLLSLTLISFFEYAFHYLGGQYAKAREYLMQNGYDVTRRLRQPPRKHDGSISTYSDNSPALSAFDSAKMTVGEYATKVEEGLQAAPEVIATEYARAQHARQQVYSKAADKLDSIQDDLNQAKADKTYRAELREGEKAYSDSPLDKPRPTSRMSVADTVQRIQRDVKANGATSPEAIQVAVFDAFAAMPNPAPLNDVALNKIADKLVINRAHTTAPAMPTNQKPGGTGLQNPALGTAEEHFPLPIGEPESTPPNVRAHSGDTHIENDVRAHSPSNVRDVREPPPAGNVREDHVRDVRAHSADKSLLEAIRDAQDKIDPDTLKDAHGLYEQWKAALLAGESVLSARGGRAFINVKLCQAHKKTITPSGMDALLTVWRKRAEREGILKANPKYNGKPPHPEYLLVA